MKVLLLSTYDSDGGAAKASSRILNEVIKNDIDASMLVRTKRTDNKNVITLNSKFRKVIDFLTPFLDHLPLKLYKNRKLHFWNVGWLWNIGLLQKINIINAEIIQLHWISEGFVPIRLLSKLKKPIIWRLSDSWAFTGGCHVPFDCTHYERGCGNCPQLKSGKENDLSRVTWKRKYRHWEHCNITIVAPSNWMADCVRKSALFKNRSVKVIFPGIDTKLFRPQDKEQVKTILNLDQKKRYIVFGAIKATDDINKGFKLLSEALTLLKERTPNADEIEILVLGSSEPIEPVYLGFKCSYLGRINDEITLSLYYSVAEVFVLPSLKDNSPNTVIESLSCGVPVVAFAACGALDMVDHNINGYLAKAYSVADLCNGLDYIMNIVSKENYEQMAVNARKKILDNFDIEIIGKKYSELYKEILA